MSMIPLEPKYAAEQVASKLAVRFYELNQLLKQNPSTDVLERIELKEQLLKELREYLAKKNKEAE
jgi:hypothetical protein